MWYLLQKLEGLGDTGTVILYVSMQMFFFIIIFVVAIMNVFFIVIIIHVYFTTLSL